MTRNETIDFIAWCAIQLAELGADKEAAEFRALVSDIWYMPAGFDYEV